MLVSAATAVIFIGLVGLDLYPLAVYIVGGMSFAVFMLEYLLFVLRAVARVCGRRIRTMYLWVRAVMGRRGGEDSAVEEGTQATDLSVTLNNVPPPIPARSSSRPIATRVTGS